MSRRGDNIRKRKDGRWEGRYKCGINENGKSIYKSVYANSYKECREKLEYKKYFSKASDVIQSLSFSVVLKLWLDSNRIRLKGSTLCKYQYMIDTHISPHLGNLKISEINSAIINSFLNKKLESGSKNNKPLSPSYVKTIAIIIEATLKYAVSEGLCDNLKSPIYKPTISKNCISVLSREQENCLNSILLQEKTAVSFGTYIALNTGIRIGELCALKWDDVDIENEVIYIKRTVSRVERNNVNYGTTLVLDAPKTSSSFRQIPISSMLKPVILENHKCKESDFIIPPTKSGFMNPRTFEYQFKSLLKKHNFEIFNFHTLRHTFATRCVEFGVDIKTLSEILGHSSVTTTLNTYVHTSLYEKRMQIEKLYCSRNCGHNMVENI